MRAPVIARIKIPPEAVVPLAIGIAALLVLLFAGGKLAAWKQRSPAAASKFGMGVGALLTACALFFLLRCLTNQSDPNNEGPHNINFTDAPTAGGMLALAAAFWRMGNQRAIAALTGIGLGALMMAKPFVWPVMRIWGDGEAEAIYPRDMLDPEHIMFFGPGLLAIIVGAIAGIKKPR